MWHENDDQRQTNKRLGSFFCKFALLKKNRPQPLVTYPAPPRLPCSPAPGAATAGLHCTVRRRRLPSLHRAPPLPASPAPHVAAACLPCTTRRCRPPPLHCAPPPPASPAPRAAAACLACTVRRPFLHREPPTRSRDLLLLLWNAKRSWEREKSPAMGRLT
jgi:hypothetical protein